MYNGIGGIAPSQISHNSLACGKFVRPITCGGMRFMDLIYYLVFGVRGNLFPSNKIITGNIDEMIKSPKLDAIQSRIEISEERKGEKSASTLKK